MKISRRIGLVTSTCVLLLLASCGKGVLRHAQEPLNNQHSSGMRVAQPRMVALGDGGGDTGAGALHRPRTWQSTKGFTAGVDYIPDQIAVKFRDELPQGLPIAGASGQPSYNPSSVLYQNAGHAEYARSLANSYDLSILSGQEAYVPGMNFCAYQIPSGEDTEELMQRILDENPQTVQYVEYVATRKAAYVPDDPGLSDQWHHSTSIPTILGIMELAAVMFGLRLLIPV